MYPVYMGKEEMTDGLRRLKKSTLKERYPEYDIGIETVNNGLKVLSWGEGAKLRIGAYCSIGNVKILLGGEHRTDWVTTFAFSHMWKEGKGTLGHPKTNGDVVIGNDVWICDEAVILSGVTIGDGAVIGARSVVTKDVPAYSIFAGNPAKFIRKRFDDAIIERLVNIKWWDWERNDIVESLPLMLNDDIKLFLDYAEKLNQRKKK